MDSSRPKLEWKDEYSVKVVEIDSQHKLLFETINELIDALGSHLSDEQMVSIMNSIITYKKVHFATEERYFKDFDYAGATEHILEHEMFNKRIAEIQSENSTDTMKFAFALIDFLEDWLIDHLMTTDQKYVECFVSHGLK
jgi:hemerythrin-like metal-binding protein